MAMDMSMENLTIAQAKEELKNGIAAYFAKDTNGEYICGRTQRIPFYLWGPPGIGKTDITAQVAEELGIGYVSFSITHHTRNSLIGLPVIRDMEDGSKYTEYTMSELIAKPLQEAEKGFTEGILVLDELNCASETIMPTLLAFLQTGNIGLYYLPENWIIVACGNPKAYNEHAKAFTPAILDRVRLINVDFDAEVFLDYAKEKDFHPIIMEYLSAHRDDIFLVRGKGEDLRMATCRGWENLSNTIRGFESIGAGISLATVESFIKMPIVASEFYKHYRLSMGSFSGKEAHKVLEGKEHEALAKLLNEGDFTLRMDAIDLLTDVIEQAAKIISAKKASLAITNVFDFADRLKDAEALRTSLYEAFCRNDHTIAVLSKIPNERYLAMAMENFGIKDRVERGAS